MPIVSPVPAMLGSVNVEFSAANQARLKELREAEQVARGKSLGV